METEIKPGVKSLELKLVSALLAAPFFEAMNNRVPSAAMFWGVLAIACLYVLARGAAKLALPGDDSSMNASETYVAAGALVQMIAAHTHGVFSQTHLAVAATCLTASFMLSRLMAKHDWMGYVSRLITGQTNFRDAAREAARLALEEAKKAAAERVAA